MAPRKMYNFDSVARALAHHRGRGALTWLETAWQRTFVDGELRTLRHGVSERRPFTVRVLGMDDVLHLTLDEAHAMAFGMAAAERAYGRSVTA